MGDVQGNVRGEPPEVMSDGRLPGGISDEGRPGNVRGDMQGKCPVPTVTQADRTHAGFCVQFHSVAFIVFAASLFVSITRFTAHSDTCRNKSTYDEGHDLTIKRLG